MHTAYYETHKDAAHPTKTYLASLHAFQFTAKIVQSVINCSVGNTSMNQLQIDFFFN